MITVKINGKDEEVAEQRSFYGKLYKWFDYHRLKKSAQDQMRRAKKGGGIQARMVKDSRGGYHVYTRAIK